jgi:anti-sigma regulatory factor (Ser/Thr protein kinase)
MNTVSSLIEQSGRPGVPPWTPPPAPVAVPAERAPGRLEYMRPAYPGWPDPPLGQPQTARLVLPAEAESACMARDFARKTLADWGVDDLVDDTVTVVSELITNAITHATPRPVRRDQVTRLQVVLIRHRRRLTVVVTDPGEDPPRPIRQEENSLRALLAEYGRGLHVVGALSHGWGWAPLTTGGKAVWSVFRQPT